MKNGVNKFAATFAVSVLSVATIASAQSLVNPGFEDGDAQPNQDVFGAPGWNGFNSRFTTEQAARTGSQSLKLFGPFFPGGGALAFQSLPVTAGDLIEASAWGFDAGSADPDGFVGVNFGLVQLVFLNAANQNIGLVDSAQINASAPDQVWQFLSASGVAPAGAVRAQIVLLHVQANNPTTGGAVFFDDAFLGLGVAPLVKGDFGGNESSDGSFNSPDNTFDGLDIEGFLLALNSEASYLALNPTLSASSLVALGDFGGNESTDGSFNTPDGAFDGLDIEGFLLALNNPAGYDAIQPPDVGGVSAIPEPAALGLLAPMGLLLSRRRR